MRFALLCLLALGCVKPDATPAPEPITVEVWHDTVCPWCRLGLHDLETVLAAWDGPPVEVVHHPFLLDPNTPPEGHDLRGNLGAKYGADRIEAMFARVSQAGASRGVRFAWDKVRLSPRTIGSHVLVDWSPPQKRRAIIQALHRAYFEEGRDIGSPDVLASLASEVALDPAEARHAVQDPSRQRDVRERAQAASNRGIRGVPHFVIGGEALHGARGPEALRAALEAAAKR